MVEKPKTRTENLLFSKEPENLPVELEKQLPKSASWTSMGIFRPCISWEQSRLLLLLWNKQQPPRRATATKTRRTRKKKTTRRSVSFSVRLLATWLYEHFLGFPRPVVLWLPRVINRKLQGIYEKFANQARTEMFSKQTCAGGRPSTSIQKNHCEVQTSSTFINIKVGFHFKLPGNMFFSPHERALFHMPAEPKNTCQTDELSSPTPPCSSAASFWRFHHSVAQLWSKQPAKCLILLKLHVAG